MVIERHRYLDKLISHMNNGLIKVITGIRRCGKSYLLFEIFYKYLLEQGVPKEKMDQKQASLVKISDSFKKIIIVSGNAKIWRNEQGITIISLFDFLLNEDSLDY